MELKLVTVAFDPEQGCFPRDPLAHIEGRVVSAVEHFFQHEGRPHLLLVVHHESSPQARKPREETSVTLTPQERPLFERLRAWRNSRGEADAVPAYTVFTNKELVEVARRRPTNLSELQQIPGIGKKKSQAYGDALLALLTSPEAT